MSKNIEKLLVQLMDLHPKYIDLSLNRILRLLKKLNNPHLNLPPIIHIAGTNGKGSTLSFIRSILVESKFKVHAYISPHLKSFNERIILSNNLISNYRLLKTLKLIKEINDNKPITFFEITTAAAFYLFQKQKADFLILETGLGGRLDATNVIKNSLIDIITPIGIDHQDFLGNNIINITDEKLGIIKKDSNIIISKQTNIVKQHIIKKLKAKKNITLYYKKDFSIMYKYKKKFSLRFKHQKFLFQYPNLIGLHQIENASVAITAILKLNELGYTFSKKNINNGIIKTKWPGRLEKGKLNNIKIYLDGAHNIDGATQLLRYFKSKKLKVWLIIGMLNNKKLYLFLKKLKPILNGVIAVPIPNEKNTFTPEEVVKICNKIKIKSYSQKSINDANLFLMKEIKPKTVLISGSLYLVGKIRDKYL